MIQFLVLFHKQTDDVFAGQGAQSSGLTCEQYNDLLTILPGLQNNCTRECDTKTKCELLRPQDPGTHSSSEGLEADRLGRGRNLQGRDGRHADRSRDAVAERLVDGSPYRDYSTSLWSASYNRKL